MDSEKASNGQDKIDWLKERGVEINIPESRNAPAMSSASPPKERKITIVKIPHDTSVPFQNVEVTIDDNIPGDQLKQILKKNFIGGSADESAVESAASGLMTTSDGPANVSKSTLMNMISNEGHVECFPLTRPHASNGYAGVSLYLDEAGQLKQLPHNSRAAALAACCGFESVPLVGDMYVARLCVAGTVGSTSRALSHESFTLGEMSSDAEWLRNATHDNFHHGVDTNQVAMESSESCGESEAVDEGGNYYTWSQTEESVDIAVALSPTAVANKKLLHVDISSTRVSVTSRESGTSVLLLDIALARPVRASESTWSIAGEILEIYLEKASEESWSSLKK